MLKNIPPILSPELLKVLAEMGHSDRICIGDGNFPGASMAKAKNAIFLHNQPIDSFAIPFPIFIQSFPYICAHCKATIMKHMITALILSIIVGACATQEIVFFIDDYSVNGKYRISDIITEENLVKDTVLFNGMAALFNDFNKEEYGNWYGYWHIAQGKHGELILRMSKESLIKIK